ncbi:MAG: 30S ribosomal protein S6 [Chitinophagales bacterium]
MNNYEVVFISTPVLSNEEYKNVVAKYTNFIANNGGEVTSKEDWGLRQLAYPIEKKTTGFYTLIEFDLPTENLKKLEIEFKRDENIMRFLSTRLNKYALKYNDSRRIRLSNNKKEEKQEA